MAERCMRKPACEVSVLAECGTLTFVAEVLHVFAAYVLSLKLGGEVLLHRKLIFGQELILLGDALLLLFLQAILQRT